MPERIPCPPPGVYENVPAAEYHAWDAASNSALNRLARSPMHARWELDNPPAPTPAKVRGDALHSAVLEPHLFDSRYVVAGTCTQGLASGARKGQPCGNPGQVLVDGGEWRCGQHRAGVCWDDGRRLLAPDLYGDCMAMRDAVWSHPDARALLEASTLREVSLVFDWPGTTIRCKARVDAPLFDRAACGDLKTTKDASEEGFLRSVEAYGYYRQDAFYRTGAEALGLPVTNFYFIAVEPERPNGVAVYDLDESYVADGREEIVSLLNLWERCARSHRWHGYAVGVRTLSRPSWKRAGVSPLPTFDEEA